jgi:hypothetical protein
MQLHIGADVSVPLDKVLFVLNDSGMTPPTRAFVEKARKERRLTPCAGKVKSYVVLKERGRERVFASHIASARWRSAGRAKSAGSTSTRCGTDHLRGGAGIVFHSRYTGTSF